MFIYEIKNKINDKRYIGQTILKPSIRFAKHIRDLNSNKHCNIYLQRAWNKYGKENFEFNLIHECLSLEELNELESKLVAENRSGYNIKEGGNNGRHAVETKKKLSKMKKGISLGKQSKKTCLLKAKKLRPNGYPILVSPRGKEYKIDNLNQFCKSRGFITCVFLSMIEGKFYQYKGWRLKTTPKEMLDYPTQSALHRRPQGYPMVKSKSGKIYSFINLRQFCREHDLKIGTFRSFINGKKNWKHYKGWTIVK